MSRLIPRLSGFRRASDARDPSPHEEAPQPFRRSFPPVGQLRPERRALVSLREDRLRDLGGLMRERCDKLASVAPTGR